MSKKKVNVLIEEVGEVALEKKGFLIWGEISTKFDKILKSIFGNFESMTEENFLERLPLMISENVVPVIDILEIATPLTREQLEQDVDPAEILDLVIAMIEVNNLLRVNENIKKLKAMFMK